MFKVAAFRLGWSGLQLINTPEISLYRQTLLLIINNQKKKRKTEKVLPSSESVIKEIYCPKCIRRSCTFLRRHNYLASRPLQRHTYLSLSLKWRGHKPLSRLRCRRLASLWAHLLFKSAWNVCGSCRARHVGGSEAALCRRASHVHVDDVFGSLFFTTKASRHFHAEIDCIL